MREAPHVSGRRGARENIQAEQGRERVGVRAVHSDMGGQVGAH